MKLTGRSAVAHRGGTRLAGALVGVLVLVTAPGVLAQPPEQEAHEAQQKGQSPSPWSSSGWLDRVRQGVSEERPKPASTDEAPSAAEKTTSEEPAPGPGSERDEEDSDAVPPESASDTTAARASFSIPGTAGALVPSGGTRRGLGLPADPTWKAGSPAADEASSDPARMARSPGVWDRDWRDVDPLGYLVPLAGEQRQYPPLPAAQAAGAMTHSNPRLADAGSGRVTGAERGLLGFFPTVWWFRAVAVSAACLTLLGLTLLLTSILKFRKFRAELLLASTSL